MAITNQQNLSTNSNEKKFEFYFHHAPIGIAILDEGGRFEEINTAFLDHVGKSKANVLKQHYSEIFNAQVCDKLQILFDILNNKHQPYAKDVITLKGVGEQHRIFEINLSIVPDYHQSHKNFLLFTEDITHQKDTHMALLQSEKLALTGRLAASLAHEINNPLQTSLGCLGLVEEILEESDHEELLVFINMAIEELKRSDRIVKKLRDLNRSTDLSERTPVNFQEIIEGVLVLTKNHLDDKDIEAVFSYQGPPPTILASKDLIQQVMLNLIMNAVDELPEGGKICLDLIPSTDPKGITIKITDTGKGIDPEIITQIFDPFFTTKDDGIGLGLYISKQIIESHSGTLEFNSQVGKGTEFTIWLPDFGTFNEKE